jgi:formate hydrogenlyase subunit 3/multisubunit Na+/H+ antiporter MnhD subunit
MVSAQQPWPGFLPLRGLANILTILLAVVVAAIAARLWWTCWRAMSARPGPALHIGVSTQPFSLCFLAIAGVLLIPIIRTVSSGPVGSPPQPVYLVR